MPAALRSSAVRRKDGRVCTCLPSDAEWLFYDDVFPRGEPDKITPFDDGVLGMVWYVPEGAVATRCGQVALFNLLCDAEITCLGCLAHR